MVVSTVDACPVCVLFCNLVNWVRAIVLLAGGASAACVHNLVLRAGAVVWNLVLSSLVLCLRFVFVDCYTLGTDGVDNLGTWGFGFVIDLVCCVLLLVYSVTLKLAGAYVVVVGVVAIDIFCCNARSIIWISCCISLALLLFTKFFIDLAQSAIAAITLSACVMVGQVRLFWLKCIVSVKRLFLVDFMWHLCVWYCYGGVANYHPLTVWYAHVPLLSVFSCTCTDMPIGASSNFYSQTVLSDGHMPKRLEFHWTDAKGWLLFSPVVGVYPTMTAENLVLCLQVHWGSVSWNSLWLIMLHFCGVCLVVLALA